jgi:hypothetical protein
VTSYRKEVFPLMKKLACVLLIICAGLYVANMAKLPASGAASPQPQTYSFSLDVHHAATTGGNGHGVLGSPSISAAYIGRVLAENGSPAASDAQALYSLGVQYGIDPAYALAFFHHESSYGTTGEATVTMSLGNERCIQDRPCNADNFTMFNGWVDGFQHWYSLILDLYVKQWGRSTVESIIPKYAPGSDHNDEAAYIQAIVSDVALYRSESAAR